jgi:hypothetical protein
LEKNKKSMKLTYKAPYSQIVCKEANCMEGKVEFEGS